MNSHQEMVRQFHKKFGLTMNETPTIPSDKDVALRINLIMEESAELLEAASLSLVEFEGEGISKSIVGVADACADLLYVIFGAANTYGLILSLDMNMADELGFDDPIFLSEFPEEHLAKMNRQLMEANMRYVEACLKKDLGKIWLSLNNLAIFAHAVSKACGIKIHAVFEEVQRSNMSKIWTDGTVHRRESDGKILKPPTYSPADIEGVLRLQIANK